MKSLLLVVSVAVCFHATSIAQNLTRKNFKIDSIISALYPDNSPGIAVAIVKDGKPIYEKYFGVANMEHSLPLTPKSKFNISAVSEQFTAFAILLLEKKRQLSLDDDVRKYIPELSYFGDTITLRHLATHTSGLKDYGALHNMQGWRWGDVILKDDALNLAIKQKDLNFKPGEEYCYSRTGFELLAKVVSRVSNLSFAEFCKEYIFQPLGMNSTVIRDSWTKIIPNRTQSYFKTSNALVNYPSNDESVGSGNIFTTLDDMVIWCNNYSTLKIGDAAIIKKLSTQYITSKNDTINQGLGIDVRNYRGTIFLQARAASAGYRCAINLFPEHKFSVIILSNNNSTNTYKLSKQIFDMYLMNELLPATLIESNVVSISNTSSNYQFTNKQVSGRYMHESLKPGIIIEIYEVDSVLNVKMDFIQQHFHIGNNVGNRYELIENPPVKFVFDDSLNGKPQAIYKHEMGDVSKWVRMNDQDFSKIKLSDYTGEFYSEELSTTYNFIIEDGQLKLNHKVIESTAFKQTGINVFQGSIWFLNQVEFILNAKGEVKGVKISNISAKNVFFEKI